MMREMRLLAVGLDSGSSAPVLLLQETADATRVLPVWIGVPEAMAIETMRQHVPVPRPTSHHLIADVIAALGQQVDHVRITALRGSVFHGELVLGDDLRISARVSDAVALAVHLDVPIRAEEAVLDRAAFADLRAMGIEDDEDPADSPEPSDPADPADLPADQAAEVERLRRFIDTVKPEDFDR